MDFMPFYIDGAHRTGRAVVFAGTAADALLRIDGRDLEFLVVLALHHLDGVDRAVAGAVAAADLVAVHDAVLGNDHGMADLDGALVGHAFHQADGAGRADFGAAGAFDAAEAFVEGHFRLHQAVQPGRGPQHLVRAFAHAELAGGAVAVEILLAHGTGRHGRSRTRRHLLVFKLRYAFGQFPLLGIYRSGAGGKGQSGEESPASRFTLGLRFALLAGFRVELVLDGVAAAVLDAVEAGHAAAVVDGVVLRIDAGGLAALAAERAVDALVRIDHRAEQREAREQAERRADRADGVAPGAAASPGKDDYNYKGNYRHDQHGQALQIDFRGIEGIASEVGRYCGEQVVDPAVDGGEQSRRDASVGAVRCDEEGDGVESEHQQHDEQDEEPVAQPFDLLGVMETVLLALAPAADPGDDVLEDAQRADDGAVDPAEKKGQDDQADDDGQVQGQHGRQQLDLGHPAEPCVQRAREIEEQQRYQNEENSCDGYSDLT